MPMRVGARFFGNPKNDDTSLDKPMTSRYFGSRQRVPNKDEGQGHLEKCTVSNSALSSKVNGETKASKCDMSRVPKIK